MITFLIFLVIILGTVALVQLANVYRLSAELKGKKEEDISDRDNKTQATLFFAFLFAYFAGYIYLIYTYKDKLLPRAASAHGVEIDNLLDFNFVIINIVFVVTHILLFYFVFKYYGKKGRTATYFTHSNKLEMIWTIVPAITMIIIIFYGLSVWNNVMRTEAPEDAIVIELYSKQFDWTARYAGNDNALGRASIHLIDGANFLGLDSSDTKSADDIIVKTEFHLPVNRPVHFLMRSQDVIHSAYMPHFRAQMNTLPGMTTQFIFTPTITTEEMRKETGNSEFNYILLCNKICGASHFNMQMNIVVEEEEAYNKWLSEQTKFMQPASTDIGSEEKDNKLSVLNNN
jgi:cytochrome c oxidase subunit II